MKLLGPPLGMLAGALAVALAAAPARAEPPLPRTMRLEYVRGPGASECPSEDTLRFAIAGRMSRKPFAPDASARLVVAIRRKGPMLSGLAEIRDAADKVVWSFPTTANECHLVMDALAMAIGLALDPVSPAQPENTPPAPPPDDPPKLADSPQVDAPPPPKVDALPPSKVDAPPLSKVEPPPPSKVDAPPPSKVDAPRNPGRLRFDGGLAGALAIHTAAPAVGFDLTLDAGIRWRAFSIAGEFRWSVPQSAEGSDDGQVKVSPLTWGIVPCGHFSAFFLCGVGQASLVSWAGSGGAMLLPDAARSGWTFATGPRIGKNISLLPGKLALRGSADVLATLRRVTIDINGKEPVWSTPALSVVLGVGLVTDL